jgi:hypothetical protein
MTRNANPTAHIEHVEKGRVEQGGAIATPHAAPAAAVQPIDAHEPTRQLLREALDQARELVRLEVALGRHEIKGEIARTKASGIALSSAAAAAIASLSLFMVAIALSFSVQWLSALVIALVLLAMAAGLGLTGYKLLPKRPIPETTRRIGSEWGQLKQRIQ